MKTIIQMNLAAWLLCNGGQHEHTSTEAPTSLDAQLAARPLRFWTNANVSWQPFVIIELIWLHGCCAAAPMGNVTA